MPQPGHVMGASLSSLGALGWQPGCDTVGHGGFLSPPASWASPECEQDLLWRGITQLPGRIKARHTNTAHANRLFLEAVRVQHFLQAPPWRTADTLSPSIPNPAFHNFCYLPQHRQARDNLPRTASDNFPVCNLALRTSVGICCQSPLTSINRCLSSCHGDEQNIKCFYLWHWFFP